MSDPEIQNQPLLAEVNQQAATARSGRSSRAYKVAGLTLLASLLIVGQALTIYFVLSQKSDVNSLRENINNLESVLTKSRAVVVPVKMSMDALSNMMDVSVDEEASTKEPEQTAGHWVPAGGGWPACDERGLYREQQCFVGHCWCVNPADGQPLPGSLTKGPAHCSASFPGSLTHLLPV